MCKNSIYERARRGDGLADLEIIDFHAHIGPWNNFYCPDSSIKAMIHAMDCIGIKKVCISANAALSSDFHAGNLITLDAMEQYPDRVVGFVVVNPRYPDAMMDEIDYFCGVKGMKGIKIHPSYHNYPVNGPLYKVVWEYAAEHNLPVLVHTWDSELCSAKLFESLANKYPNVNFILGHSGMADFYSAVEVAKKCKNIYLELTAAAFINGVIEYFVENVGADRIIYGSDLGGWFSPIHGLGPVLYSRISDDEKKKILSENAKNILDRTLTKRAAKEIL